MSFNLDALVVDRVLRITKVNPSDSRIIWTGSHFKDGTLICDGESVTAKDEVGTPIGQFDRSKSAKFTATNAVISLNVLSDQIGATKEVASATAKINTPAIELFSTAKGAKTYELKYTPITTSVKYIYAMKDNGAQADEIPLVSDAGTTGFTLAGKKITFGSDVVTDDVTFFIRYEYEAEEAVKIANKADEFSSIGLYDIEVLFRGICDQSLKQFGHIIFERGKMANSAELKLDPEADQSIEIDAIVPYCTANKELWKIIIPKDTVTEDKK